MMVSLSSSSDLSTEEPLLSRHRTCIEVVLVGDVKEAIPLITMSLECNEDEDIVSVRCRLFSDLIEVLGKGVCIENIGGTCLSIEIPPILSKYIFVALPFCHDSNTQFIHTVKVDNNDCVVPASQIMSLLKDIESPNVTQTLDERVPYELTVHRYGDLTLFETIQRGEYTGGTFLYLMTSSDDIIDSEEEWGQEAIVRDGPHLFYPDNISRPATGVVQGKDFPECTQSKIVTTAVITSDTSDVLYEPPLTQEIPPLLMAESTTFQIEESRSQDGEQVIIGSAVQQMEGQLVLPSCHLNKGTQNLLTESPTVQLSDQFTEDYLAAVHVLHHIYNDKPCQYSKNECRNMLSGSKELSDYCMRVKRDHQCDNLSDQDTYWLKCTIRFHCESCRDETCRIPHLFAGCPPPTSFSLSDDSNITDDNSSSSSSQDSGSIQTPQPTQPLVPSQTTLSPPGASPSYQYPPPVVATGEGGTTSMEYIVHRPRHQQNIFHQPSITQRQSVTPPKYNLLERLDARKKAGYSQQQMLPENLANKRHGDILYDPEGFLKRIFPSGKMTALPKFSELPKYDRIGKGGNGVVIKFPIEGEYYALKYTTYRKMENSLWSGLCHENILLLLGTVTICPEPSRCCQIMSLMTVSLRDELRDIGGSILDGLARRIPEAVLHINVRHVIRSILQGLDYLFQQHLHHRDLKERNILVYKTCRCPNILQCLCHEKACIQIADFDSILLVKTAFPGAFTGYNDYPVTPKSPEKCAKVLGTPGNRAPEQFMEIAPAIIPNYTKVNIAGPWSDIWSFGVLVMNMLYGTNQRQLTKEANILCFQPYRTTLDKKSPQVELVLAQLKLKELFKEDNLLIRRIARLVDKCIQADFRNRSTPEDLLQDEFFSKC